MTTHLTDTQKTQIRIALAKWMGWTEIETRIGEHVSGQRPNHLPTMFGELIPNYPADLNACHAIEVKLKDEQRTLFYERLVSIIVKTNLEVCSADEVTMAVISASAEHRALALYHALNLGELGD